MTIKISPDDDRDEIARKVGGTVDNESLRTSETRRRRLEQSSQRRTRVWDLRLDIDPKHPTAHVDQNTGTPEVVVTGRRLPQPVSDLDGADWDYAAQRALSWHEDGHVLFTDHDDFAHRLKIVSSGDKGTAKQLWNALEDGAIEKAIAAKWSNAYDVLRLLRINLFHDNEPGIMDVERGGQVFPVAHATQAVLLDEWMSDVYDIDRGVKAKLLSDDPEYHFAVEEDRELFIDEILPLIENVVPDVLSEPNSVQRNRRIFEFIEEVLDHLDDSKADGKSQMNRDENETSEGMPDDASEGHSGPAQQDADVLADVEPEDIDKVVVGGEEPSGPPVDVELPDDVEVEIAEDVGDQRREEAGVSGELIEELEDFAEALDSGSEGLAQREIVLPSGYTEANESVYQEASGASQVLAQLLRNRLQQERHSERKLHQRRGRYTGRGGAGRRAIRGEKEVKERVIQPEDKDYHFAFVLDRSGSMRGRTMREAEKALGMLALALEKVGVEVMVVEMINNEARLAKPFQTAVEANKDNLFHGQTAGSTPLSESVDVVRERLKGAAGNTAMVVVTDGDPDSPTQFKEAIRNCSMPTLGVNLTSADTPSGMDDYDRAVAARPGSDLQQTLTQLIQEIMF